MKIKNIKVNLLMIVVMSFLGFCFEDLWMLIRYSVLDNRHMYLPFLLGYGVFVVVLYYLIGTPRNLCHNDIVSVLLYFFTCFILVSVGEYLLGTILEKTGGFSYWNYTKIPYHLSKYTSVPTSFGFSLAITLFMEYVFVPLYNKVSKCASKMPLFIVILLAIILFTDFVLSFIKMYQNHGKHIIWRLKFK